MALQLPKRAQAYLWMPPTKSNDCQRRPLFHRQTFAKNRRVKDELVPSGARAVYRPFHCGGRFSWKAFTPSSLSSVEKTTENRDCSCRRPWSRGRFTEAFTAAF